MKKLCIIGLGNMGQAIFDALEDGSFEIVGCDRGDDLNNKTSECDAALVAVKPQDFNELATGLDLSGKLIISIMTGISVGKIQEALGADKVVRVVPNLPLKVGSGVSGWYASDEVSGDEKETVSTILKSFGTEVEIDNEDDINKVTALSGSGPAYYYYMNRALRIKALEMGFNEEQARKLVGGTFLGAAKLLEESEDCSGKLISKISSKGGTTEAAVNYLDEKKVDDILGDAVEAAYKRAKELND